MIPNIFISSTIQDLHHLRDIVRDTIAELAYRPVMSEYGDIGYLPTTSAEDACYLAMRDCQLAIIIVGKRYGSISHNGLSVTQNEFLAAKSQSKPIVCLVDSEVMSFKRVFDENDKVRKLKAPGMDEPLKTFAFLQEISESPLNNGILDYRNAADATTHLKNQLAHLMNEYLRGQFDPIKAEVKDILSEIKTLRHELVVKDDKSGNDYLRAIRFLIDSSEDSVEYRKFINEIMKKSIDEVVPALLKSDSFDKFVEYETGCKLEVTENPVSGSTMSATTDFLSVFGQIDYYQTRSKDFKKPSTYMLIAVTVDGKVIVNQSALITYRELHQKLLKFVSSIQ